MLNSKKPIFGLAMVISTHAIKHLHRGWSSSLREKLNPFFLAGVHASRAISSLSSAFMEVPPLSKHRIILNLFSIASHWYWQVSLSSDICWALFPCLPSLLISQPLITEKHFLFLFSEYLFYSKKPIFGLAIVKSSHAIKHLYRGWSRSLREKPNPFFPRWCPRQPRQFFQSSAFTMVMEVPPLSRLRIAWISFSIAWCVGIGKLLIIRHVLAPFPAHPPYLLASHLLHKKIFFFSKIFA